jgi:putative DNA primase/helicase
MKAREVALALGKAARAGHDWLCRCPVHGGASLSLADGGDGTLLIHCFGGCESRAVWNELRDRGLIAGSSDTRSPKQIEEQRRRDEAAANAKVQKIRRRISRARAFYAGALPAAGTPVEVYLRSRGITIPVPPVLRWSRLCLHRNGSYYPAMVAPIVNVRGEQIGFHKTFLRPDGSGKAGLPKKEQRETCGPMKGGAVRLAECQVGVPLLIGEGIESTLSAMQMFRMPGWAALCAGGIEALELPDDVIDVVIAADHDANGIGQRGALVAHRRWSGEVRRTKILIPPAVDTDFNDVLRTSGSGDDNVRTD